MLKLEFNRYLFSKSTIIILIVLTLISTISWGASLSEQQMWINQYHSNYEDINRAAVSYMIYHYNGLLFLYNLWFNNGGLSSFKIYFIYAWIGMVLTSRLHVEKSNRFGNLIITRRGYKQRLHHILSAQSLYITTIVGAYVLISAIGSLLLGGLPQEATPIGHNYYSWGAWLGIILLQFLWLSFSFIIINTFCLLLNMWIKQKHILQVLPFALFIIAPVMLWPITMNSFPVLFNIVSLFVADNTILALEILFQHDGTLYLFLRSAGAVIVTTIGVAILYPLHTRKGAKDYL